MNNSEIYNLYQQYMHDTINNINCDIMWEGFLRGYLAAQPIKVTICVGIPASGKTTWAEQQVCADEYCVDINRDIVRLEILKERLLLVEDTNMWTVWDWSWEPEVTTRINEKINSALRMHKRHLIFSDTNLNIKYRNMLEATLVSKGIDCSNITLKYFDIDLDTANQRDVNRIHCVGKEVINKLYKQYSELMR